MNLAEFSNGFDTLIGSYRRFKDFDRQEMPDSIEFNEYEKSLFLTKAQEELVIGCYSGKNTYGDSFESTEELRRQLDSLVRTKVYTEGDRLSGMVGVSGNSVFFSLPDKLAFITMEQVTFGDETLGCHNGFTANVYPVRQDEYGKIKDNPFRGPTRYKVLRLDSGEGIVELVSKYGISEYLIKYIERPEPIILETLPEGLTIEGVGTENECKLNPMLHNAILERAVVTALRTKMSSTSNTENTDK